MWLLSVISKSYNGKFSKRFACLYTAGIYEFEIWQTVNIIYKTIVNSLVVNKLAVNSSLIVG